MKKTKLLDVMMVLLDGKENKHVERRCWTRQWVSRREERGTYYTIFNWPQGFCWICRIHENAAS